MKPMRAQLVGVAFLFLSAVWHPVVLAESTNSNTFQNAEALIDWIHTKPKGFVSSKLSLKQGPDHKAVHSSAGSSIFFEAASPISEGKTVLFIPKEVMLNSGGTGDVCDTLQTFLDEIDQRNDTTPNSQYQPYLRYLFGKENSDTGLRPQPPASWSQDAQNLLQKILGRDLLPQKFKKTCVQNCAKVCAEDGDQKSDERKELEEMAFLFVASRSWDDVMIPVFDMINHRNGKWRNVDLKLQQNGASVFAVRDIDAGEELYISHTECESCGDYQYSYVTQHFFEAFGFVEAYPRRWVVYEDGDESLVVEIDTRYVDGRQEKALQWQEKALQWHSDLPNPYHLNYINAQLTHLRNLDEVVETAVAVLDSVFEKATIVEYFEGYKEALKLALVYREGDVEALVDPSYDDLTEPKGVGVEGLNTEVCIHGPSDRGYDYKDDAISQYQSIGFTHNNETDNSCLELSGWIQACSNFRPHYHEAVVHIPAQYVADVKRVIFMGGGDNMILHEILKYPNLELVVGLELDQQVIRSSFKNLGTLPYFDAHRVHWYFGDATKSLFALPESYFGTFDLVLVDLQTFVADTLKVSDKLTIMDTAMLLMKQDGGVIAKNEDFPVRINTGFARYTVDLEIHDLPHICQQSITLGSNSVDFFKTTPIYHGIDTMAIDLPSSSEDSSARQQKPFDKWYNYRHTVVDTCTNTDNTNDVTSAGQEAPLHHVGLFIVLEAENLSLSLESAADVQAKISEAIKGVGLTELSVSSHKNANPNSFVHIMKEGYIQARLNPDKKYIGFDLYLWEGAVPQIDAVTETLVAAMGGNMKASTTSFRFIMSGIHGLDSAPKDFLQPLSDETRKLQCGIDIASLPAADISKVVTVDKTTALLEAFFGVLLRNANSQQVPFIGVLCGRNTDTCTSLEALQNTGKTSTAIKAVPFYSCDSSKDMESCQANVSEKLQDTVMQNKKIDALVLDTEVTFQMGQVLEKIFHDKVIFDNLLEESHLVMSPVPEGESWRHVLIDRFRTDYVLFDPSYHADLQIVESLGKEKAAFNWSLFSSGNTEFFRDLESGIEAFQSKTGLQVNVEQVLNGIINLIADFEVKEFRNSDYDKTRATQQWKSQTPLGHQTLFQFALKQSKTPLEVGESVLAESSPGPLDMKYRSAEIKKVLGDQMYQVKLEGIKKLKTLSRYQLRKFSEADQDMALTFEVGDVIFYKNSKGVYQNGVISKQELDGRYSIYLLNTSGKKIYGVPRENLMYQFESAAFVEEMPELTATMIMNAFERALRGMMQETDHVREKEFSAIKVGAGGVMTSFWEDGSAILKWDGKHSVDVNLYTSGEDKTRRMRQVFYETFTRFIDNMEKLSQDEHP